VPIIDVKTGFVNPKRRREFTDSVHFTEGGSDMCVEIVASAIQKDVRWLP
jgi:hypothetical protein